jgi:hypothetical protein
VPAPASSPLPPGSLQIARWAASRRLAYEAHPDEVWFRRWEPHDTIAPPSHFFNACTWVANPGHAVIVEPWYAPEDAEPLERTMLAFASHPGIVRRAAMRVGEHFLTRVAYIESPPPPKVTVGDKLWDEHVTSYAASSSEAAAAFHPRLRKLISGWGFKGHIELRPGGVVVFEAGLRPTPEGYDRLFWIIREVTGKAANPR